MEAFWFIVTLGHHENGDDAHGGQLCGDVKVGFPSNTVIGIISGEPHICNLNLLLEDWNSEAFPFNSNW